MKDIKIGLIGFGTVGSGLVKILTDNAALIEERLGCPLVLKTIADHDIERDRGVALGGATLTANSDEVLDDPEISIVVELIGGTGAAKDLILKAFDKGKHVVTANKALLSTYGQEIFSVSEDKQLNIGFEASVAGGIPIIKALREGLTANRVESIYGIINGTANYIMSTMTNLGGNFADVLKDAQELGYAEADPTYDVEGIDAAHKLAILINLAYGTAVSHEDIYTEGISRITGLDIDFARQFGYKIKLLAIAKADGNEIEARVHPTMIAADHPLSSVEGVFNAVHMVGDAVGPVMFYGQGAGMMATASAVAGDVIDIARDIRKGVAMRVPPLGHSKESEHSLAIKDMAELTSLYYLRFTAVDKPSVLARISGVLGKHGISISSVIQQGREDEGDVPLVIVTHHAKERDLLTSLSEIEQMDVVVGKTLFIRIEETCGSAD